MDPTLFIFEPPYDAFKPIDLVWRPPAGSRGLAIVWLVSRDGIQAGELDWVIARPRGLSCAIVFPPPNEIPTVAAHLPRLMLAEPNAVLPSGRLTAPSHVKAALSVLPRNVGRTVANYLWRHRFITQVAIRAEVERIFQLAPRVRTVSQLCRELYMSRRTLGRHFEAYNLPVPSHWLQFARVLHVTLRAQSERIALFRIATAAGYSDGFTFSNQAKRVTGIRPSQARSLVGHEWLIESWLAREEGRVAGSDEQD